MLPTQTRYAHSAITSRPTYDWPGGKRLAFYVALNVEQFAFMAGRGNDPHNRQNPAQTTRNYAWRDYGLRVGIWRLLQMFDELGLPATILLNSLVGDLYPDIVSRLRERGDDIVAHGRTNAETLAGLWEPDEARIIGETTDSITRSFGTRPTGWMGPGAQESRVTCDLVREAGYTHTLGWPIDDQPIWMATRAGPLLSVPYPMELNDMGTNVARDHSGREFADMVVDQFDELLEQSEAAPLVMSVALHTFVVGQPFRLRPLRQALRHVTAKAHQDRVWLTTAGAIAAHCFTLPPGLIPGSQPEGMP